MDKISAIQVIIDPLANAQPAVQKAATLAATFDARLDLLLVDTQAAQQARAMAKIKKSGASETLREPKALIDFLKASLREQGLQVTSQIDFADPLHDALLRHIKQLGANLVVKDTHHHSFLKRTFLTNTDWQLIRRCPTPLLLTKSAPWKTPPTIIAAIDPAHLNDKPATLDRQLLEWGALLTRKLHGSLHVAHAFIPASLMAAANAATMSPILAISPEMIEIETTTRRTQIRSLVSDFGIDDEHVHLELGSASEVLPELSSKLLGDVLIAGAISRSAISRAFVGNTAEQILERVSGDILVVKPRNFSEDLPF